MEFRSDSRLSVHLITGEEKKRGTSMNLAEREINFKRYTKKPSLNYTSIFLTAQTVCNYFHPADLRTHSARSRWARTKREGRGEKNAYAPVLYIADENLSENSGGRCSDAMRLKREIGYVIYIAVLLRGRQGALESFYVHFFHVNTVAFVASRARQRCLRLCQTLA